MPGASSMRGITGYRLSDVMNGALAQLIPRPRARGRARAAARSRSSPAGSSSEPFVYSELVVGTWGGRPVADGNDGLANPCASMANIPVELAESDWPIMIERYGLVPDSGGAGRYRGGLAVERVWRVRSCPARPCTCAPTGRCTARTASRAGSRAQRRRALIFRAGRDARADAADVRRASARSRATSSTTGCPAAAAAGTRSSGSREAVAQDVLDEKVSVAAARELYGVVVAQTARSTRPRPRRCGARRCRRDGSRLVALRIRRRRPRRDLLGLEPVFPAARALGRAFTVHGAPAPTTSRSTTRSRPRRARRGDRARVGRRAAGRPLRRDHRDRRPRARGRRDRARRRDPRPSASSRRSACRSSSAAPRRAARARRARRPRRAGRARRRRGPVPATSSAPTRTGSPSSPPPTPTRSQAAVARARGAGARDRRGDPSAARRPSTSSG